jgi:hypothetical protein
MSKQSESKPFHPGNYADEPPATFKCGHPRERANMSFCNGNPACKQCLTARHRAYRAAHPNQETLRIKLAMLAESQAARPHLYPPKQAA